MMKYSLLLAFSVPNSSAFMPTPVFKLLDNHELLASTSSLTTSLAFHMSQAGISTC